MNYKDKKDELRRNITASLIPLIYGKVAIFGLPLHGNIGDTLITIGEMDFLKSIGAKCIYKRFFIEDGPLPKLPKECIILLQGGGDFGDVWRGIQQIRLNVIKFYRNHKIIIFPQSVHYDDINLMKADAQMLEKIPDLTICARDNVSFDILKANFKNKILLVPDMAFFINEERLVKHKKDGKKGPLYLKRIDKELNKDHFPDFSGTVSDWPTINNSFEDYKKTYKQIGLAAGFRRRKLPFISNILHRIYIHRTLSHTYPFLLKTGVGFITDYDPVIVTRLHAAILAVLLEKDFSLCDNSYGKSKNLFDTWLKGLDSATLLS